MNCFVTGCAGFIGSHLVDRLLASGCVVTGFDNFSTGQREFLESAEASERFRLVEGDLLDQDSLNEAMAGHDMVFHLAANADVRFGTHHPERDLQQNTIATFHVLEAMRGAGVRRIMLASTGSVYGEPTVFPTPETCPFPVQTSLYAASKIAAEGLVSAYCHGYGFAGLVFRFVSILGPRYTHGHVVDFFSKLQSDPTRITVLGNGKQRKSYLHVDDCIRAVLLAAGKHTQGFEVFNLGTEEYCCVDDSLGWICETMGIQPRREYTGGERGWIGDSPFIFLDTKKIQTLGWRPSRTIRDSVQETLMYLTENPWIVDCRPFPIAGAA